MRATKTIQQLTHSNGTTTQQEDEGDGREERGREDDDETGAEDEDEDADEVWGHTKNTQALSVLSTIEQSKE